jgi:mRNA interferase RelE/StbE
MYEIIYRKSALKALAKMPDKLSLQFTTTFKQIADYQEAGLDIKSWKAATVSGCV